MTRLLLVRHACPAGNWDEDADAGLDDAGRAQARALVASLGPRGPLSIVTSPTRRTRETAAPLAAAWGRTPRIEDAVGEIPSPVDDLAARGAWLRDTLHRRWGEVPAELHEWRAGLLDALVAIEEPAVVVTHYVAINAAVGAATDDDRLVVFSPGHASVTEVEIVDGALRLIARGDEAATSIR